MCLPFQQQECYELSPAAEITSFILNLCVAKSGDGLVGGIATVAAFSKSLPLPVAGAVAPSDGGYEIDLALEIGSTVPLVQSVKITLITDDQFQGLSATYTIVFTNGITVKDDGSARSIPCS